MAYTTPQLIKFKKYKDVKRNREFYNVNEEDFFSNHKLLENYNNGKDVTSELINYKEFSKRYLIRLLWKYKYVSYSINMGPYDIPVVLHCFDSLNGKIRFFYNSKKEDLTNIFDYIMPLSIALKRYPNLLQIPDPEHEKTIKINNIIQSLKNK